LEGRFALFERLPKETRQLRFLQMNESPLVQINSRSGSTTSPITPASEGHTINGKGPTGVNCGALKMQKVSLIACRKQSICLFLGSICLSGQTTNLGPAGNR
jgi:hypothetical protein